MTKIFLATVFFFSFNTYAATGIARLDSGNTAFELDGRSNDPLVIMVHGVSGPMSVWDNLYEAVVSSGFRVLRYDLYGRGQSERVPGPYNHALFQAQLEELLEYLFLADQRINFIASSMGNIIASEFIQRNPERAATLTMIGPAGFPIKKSLAQRILLAPLVGDMAVCIGGHNALMERNREYFYDPVLFEEFLISYEDQLRIKGSKKAILSTMRNMPVQNYIEGYSKLADLNIPTLLVWGEDDVSFPFKFSQELLDLMPDTQFLPVSKAAHLPQLEHPEVLMPRILELLREN